MTRTATLALALALAGCPGRGAPPPGEPGEGPSKVLVEVYFMSQCPYSATVMKILPDVAGALHAEAEFDFHAVVKDVEGGEYAALHGPQELFGDLLALCAAESAPDDLATVAFMECFSRNIMTVPFGWEDCAEMASIPVMPVKECTLGQRGQELLASSFASADKRGITRSPVVYVDGVPVNVELSEVTLTDAICCAIEPGLRPAACPGAPECYNMRVDLTVITDARCEECAAIVDETLAVLTLPFPVLEIERLDWSDAAAAPLASDTQIELLPAFLFHDNVKSSAGYDVLVDNSYEAGGYVVVLAEAVDAKFDPEAEICTNGSDDTGDGLADCDDPACKERLPCRPAVPSTLDLFVMSECPFGNEALSASAKAHKHFKGALKLRVHWIATVAEAERFASTGLPEGCVLFGDHAYCSMHGVGEVEEDLRQACVQEIGGTDALLSFAECRTKSLVELEWTECADAAGVDPAKVSACAEGAEGHDLLHEDARVGDLIGADASPSYLWNNSVLESVPFTAAAIAAKACAMNPGMKHCDKIEDLDVESHVPPEAKCYE